MKPAKGADLFNGAGYRRRVSRVIRACEQFRRQSRKGEDGHPEETHMEDWYPTECLLSVSCKEGTGHRG